MSLAGRRDTGVLGHGRWKMSLAARFLIIVIGLAAAVSAAMVPRANEWLAVMNDDHKQAQIVATLEPRLAQDPQNANLLATLGRAYADLGDAQQAIPLLEHYVELRPADADAYGRLAGQYGLAGDTDRQQAALVQAVALAPTVPRIGALATLLRARGKADEERALLMQFEPALTVQSGLVLRLAQLYEAQGDYQRAIAALSRSDIVRTVPKGFSTGEERLLLATLLAKTGQGADAARFGIVWIAQWNEPWLANRLLMAVAQNASVQDTVPLADAVAVLHPEIRLYLVTLLAGQGSPAIADHLLRTWRLAHPEPSATELAAFLSSCRQWGEPAIVWEAFASALRGPTAPEIVARYADAVAAEFGIGALAPFWSAMSPAALAAKPLLSARLAFAEQDPARARYLAEQVDVASLLPSEQRLWADLMAIVAPPEAVFARLRLLEQKDALPPVLQADYVRLAGGFGHYPALQK